MLLKMEQINESNVESNLNAQDNEVHDVEYPADELLQKNNIIEELNSSLHETEYSPMKLHALGDHGRSCDKENVQINVA